MFTTKVTSLSFAARTRAHALEGWRTAALLVRTRWQAFLDAEPENRRWAFASDIAALDAEGAAAADVAGRRSQTAA